jgi:hypothetical protein
VEYRMYVGGASVESEPGARAESTSLATGETIGSVPETLTELKTVVVELG